LAEQGFDLMVLHQQLKQIEATLALYQRSFRWFEAGSWKSGLL